MKFKLSNGGTLEVSGIKRIVTNVERNGKRVGKTVVWRLHKNRVWLRYPTMNAKKPNYGAKPGEMRMSVQMACSIPIVKVWVSGNTMNFVTKLEEL